MKNKIYITIYLFAFSFIACDDYLDIEPVGKIIPKSVKEYRSLLTSAYSKPKNNKELTTFRTDELSLDKNRREATLYEDIFIWNDSGASPVTVAFSYATFYSTIFTCNHIIEQRSKIIGNSSDVNQLVGEAYALRALQYFELINLYAKPYNKATANTDIGVPIVTTYDSEQSYPRQSVKKVYDLIQSDIENAEKYLNINKQKTGYNYRFSVIALKSLKARVYLYQKEWQQAVNTVKSALKLHGTLMNLNVKKTIMPSEYNSVESILALDNVSSLDISSVTTISNDLINEYDTTNDLRFALYFDKNSDGNYTTKKTSNAKYKCTFRTAELYLILAEASVLLDDIATAKETLISFAKNRYTPTKWNAYKTNINSLSKENLRIEILKERKREFAIEGHRWNDLRRTSQPEIKKIYKGQTYTLQQGDSRYVIPFPKEAVINNPDL